MSTPRAKVLGEFFQTEKEFAQNMEKTVAALQSSDERDKPHLQRAYEGRLNMENMVSDFARNVAAMPYMGDMGAEDGKLDPEIFEQHLKAMTNLALQAIAINGLGDDFNAKVKKSIFDTQEVLMKASPPQSTEDMQRLSDQSASTNLAFVSQKNTLLNPMQRLGKYPLLLRDLLKTIPETDKDFANCKRMAELSEYYMASLNATVKLDAKRDDLLVNLEKYVNDKGRHADEANKIIQIIKDNTSGEEVFAQVMKIGKVGKTGRLHGLVEQYLKESAALLAERAMLAPDENVVAPKAETPTTDDEQSSATLSDSIDMDTPDDSIEEPTPYFDEILDAISKSEKKDGPSQKDPPLSMDEFLDLAGGVPTPKAEAPKAEAPKAEAPKAEAPQRSVIENGKRYDEKSDIDKLHALREELNKYLNGKNPGHRVQADALLMQVNSAIKKSEGTGNQPDLSGLVISVQQLQRDIAHSSLAKFIGIGSIKGGRFSQLLSVFNNVAMQNPELCKNVLEKMQDTLKKNMAGKTPSAQKKLQAEFDKNSKVVSSAIQKHNEPKTPVTAAVQAPAPPEPNESSTPRPGRK